MNTKHMAFISVFLTVLAGNVAEAATINISGGTTITGVGGVIANGKTYNVTFSALDGNQLSNGLVSLGDFLGLTDALQAEWNTQLSSTQFNTYILNGSTITLSGMSSANTWTTPVDNTGGNIVYYEGYPNIYGSLGSSGSGPSSQPLAVYNTSPWAKVQLNAQLVATPLPSTAFMFIPSILGLFGYESHRKKRAI